MEDLQDNIVRTFDMSTKGYITQQDAWDNLIDLDLITNSFDKDYFLHTFLTVVKNYNSIYLQIIDDVYYLTNENVIITDNEFVTFSLPIKSLIEFINYNQLMPFDSIISMNGNTIAHHIILNNMTNILTSITDLNCLSINNKSNKTPIDYIPKNDTNILYTLVKKIEETNKILSNDITKMNYVIKSNEKCLKLIKNKYNLPMVYHIVIGVVIGIVVKFLLDKIFY